MLCFDFFGRYQDKGKYSAVYAIFAHLNKLTLSLYFGEAEWMFVWQRLSTTLGICFLNLARRFQEWSQNIENKVESKVKL